MTIEDVSLGTKEQEKQTLDAKPIKVMDITKQTYTGKDGKETKPIIQLWCKHPDKTELIELRKAKIEKNKQLTVTGMWLTLDDEGKISKNSALGQTMNKYKATSINGLIGKELETIKEEGYLVIKGY